MKSLLLIPSYRPFQRLEGCRTEKFWDAMRLPSLRHLNFLLKPGYCSRSQNAHSLIFWGFFQIFIKWSLNIKFIKSRKSNRQITRTLPGKKSRFTEVYLLMCQGREQHSLHSQSGKRWYIKHIVCIPALVHNMISIIFNSLATHYFGCYCNHPCI